MKFQNKNHIVYFTLALGFISGIILILITQNSFGGGDSIQHFNMAHWGWKYPHLLFNHWGKPIFTILISPFAQIGLDGVRIYNLFIGFGTGVVIWRIAQFLNFRNSELSILFVLFTPIYFILMFTPLTEVSFSFFLALSILLFFKKKYYFSALILSFLPLIRTEGIVLFPLFILAYIFRKKVLAIPILLSGFLIISLAGYTYYDDFLWLITKMPYSGSAKDIYGSGSLFHFLNDTRGILGYPLGILFVIGLIISIIQWGQKDKFKFTETFYFLLLVPGSYIVFLSAHSYVWWQGIGNSLGLVRVIGSTTPLAALTALLGFNLIIDLINRKNKVIGKIMAYGIVFWIFGLGINTHRSGFKLSANQKLIKQTTTFLEKNNLVKHKLYYFDPYVVYELNIDPYDRTQCNWGLPNKEKPSLGIPDSSIIIWDSHFGPNEGRVSLEVLQEQKTLSTVKIFKPATPFTVLGGHDYEVYLFMKDISLYNKLITSFSFDYETSRKSSSYIYHTGSKSQHVTSNISYITGIDTYLQDMFYSPGAFSVSVSGYIFLEKTIDNELPLVCTMEDINGTNYYKTYDLRNQVSNVGEWNYFEHNFIVSNVSTLEELLKVYIWNKHKQDFYLDDFNLEVKKDLKQSFIFDFESDENADTTLSISGNKCSFISTNTEYSIGPEIIIADLGDTITDINVSVKGYIFLKKSLTYEVPLVCAMEHDGALKFYLTSDLREQITRIGEWLPFNQTFKINNIQSMDELIKVYIWNKNEQEFYLDDFEISIETSRNPSVQ